MEACDVKRMKEPEAERSQLKRMHADPALDSHATNGLIQKSSEAARAARGGPIHG